MTPANRDPASAAHLAGNDDLRAAAATVLPAEAPVALTQFTPPEVLRALTQPGSPPKGLPQVPGYEVIDKIAEGGMGMVLLGRDPDLGRENSHVQTNKMPCRQLEIGDEIIQ